MTATDDERREVARRLRGIDAERLDRVYGMDGEGGECSDPDMAKARRNLMLGAIAEAIGLHYAPYYSGAAPLRDRLADLIEPAYDHFVESDEKVDREALLELADKLECDGECDGCDMSDGIWCDAQGYAARRIREALGEVE